MSVHIDIQHRGNENNLSMLRRFRTRVRAAGILNRAKGHRFYERPKSKFQVKQNRLSRLQRKKERERLYKLGKIS